MGMVMAHLIVARMKVLFNEMVTLDVAELLVFSPFLYEMLAPPVSVIMRFLPGLALMSSEKLSFVLPVFADFG